MKVTNWIKPLVSLTGFVVILSLDLLLSASLMSNLIFYPTTLILTLVDWFFLCGLIFTLLLLGKGFFSLFLESLER